MATKKKLGALGKHYDDYTMEEIDNIIKRLRAKQQRYSKNTLRADAQGQDIFTAILGKVNNATELQKTYEKGGMVHYKIGAMENALDRNFINNQTRILRKNIASSYRRMGDIEQADEIMRTPLKTIRALWNNERISQHFLSYQEDLIMEAFSNDL